MFNRSSSIECYTFSIINDEIGEPTEVFEISFTILSGPASSINNTAGVTVLDDDGNN